MSLGIGLVGFGYWGPNLARNISDNPDLRLVAVCDANAASLDKAGRRYPGISCYGDPAGMLTNPAVEAVVVASPVATHAPFALAALRAGRHVLVEKPMALNTAQARAMIEEAERRRLTLMVDHTFVFGGAVRKIDQLLRAGELGRLLYYDSVRINLGLFQSDVDVLWDLAVHDLSILDSLRGDLPAQVSCITHRHFDGAQANMAYLTMTYDDGMIAHAHVNWLSPVKIRHAVFGGDRRMVVYDDIAVDEKVKVYDRGVGFSGSADMPASRKVDYRSGEISIPTLERREPLAAMLDHFAASVRNGTPPLTGGAAGLRVLKVLEAAERSARQHGVMVAVQQDEG